MQSTNKSVTIFLEERFTKLPDGRYHSIIFGDEFWKRYLSIFDQVHVIARVKEISSEDDLNHFSLKNITNKSNVFFHEVPYYHGAKQFIFSFFKILFFMSRISNRADAFILRMPGLLSMMIFPFLFIKGKNYGVELVGDPYDVFGSGGVGGGFSKILQYIFTKFTKFSCYYAKSVAYVTKTKMQFRYPANGKALTTHYSSIALPANLIIREKSIINFNNGVFNILMVGSMDQMYKGFDVMLAALQQIKTKHPNIVIHIIGGGKYRYKLDAMVEDFDLLENVNFLGLLSRDTVFMEMDKSDLFVMPSRTEGLPRALIEAMARGLPAIGSNVGGIPELLSKNYIFESENVEQLAALLETVIPDQNLRTEMSKENIAKSWDYEETELQSRREIFYKSLLNNLKNKEVL